MILVLVEQAEPDVEHYLRLLHRYMACHEGSRNLLISINILFPVQAYVLEALCQVVGSEAVLFHPQMDNSKVVKVESRMKLLTLLHNLVLLHIYLLHIWIARRMSLPIVPSVMETELLQTSVRHLLFLLVLHELKPGHKVVIQGFGLRYQIFLNLLYRVIVLFKISVVFMDQSLILRLHIFQCRLCLLNVTFQLLDSGVEVRKSKVILFQARVAGSSGKGFQEGSN